jgi:hypothetical protein
MGVYDLVKHELTQSQTHGASSSSAGEFGVKIMAGLCGGAVGSLIANPTDLIKSEHKAKRREGGGWSVERRGEG